MEERSAKRARLDSHSDSDVDMGADTIPQPGFGSLCSGLILKIFKYLPATSYGNVASVCRYWEKLCRSPLLQKHLSLPLSSLSDRSETFNFNDTVMDPVLMSLDVIKSLQPITLFWDMKYVPLSAISVKTFTHSGLKKLHFCRYAENENATSVDCLKFLTQLTSLTFEEVHLDVNDDTALNLFHHLTQLRTFRFLPATATISSLNLNPLPRLHQLTELNISGFETSEATLSFLTPLTQLRSCVIHTFVNRLPDEVIPNLAVLTRLTKLDVNIGSFAQLTHLTRLTALGYHQKFTSETVQSLASLPRLTDLNVVLSKLSKNGLHRLCSLTRLTRLHIPSPIQFPKPVLHGYHGLYHSIMPKIGLDIKEHSEIAPLFRLSRLTQCYVRDLDEVWRKRLDRFLAKNRLITLKSRMRGVRKVKLPQRKVPWDDAALTRMTQDMIKDIDGVSYARVEPTEDDGRMVIVVGNEDVLKSHELMMEYRCNLPYWFQGRYEDSQACFWVDEIEGPGRPFRRDARLR